MRPSTDSILDGAIRDVLAGAVVIAQRAASREGRAATRALQASLTLALADFRPCALPGAREQALLDLCAAVAELRGDDVGLDSMPARYDTGGRETLDRIRDLLGDQGFVAGCLFNVVKYLDRAGKKGPAYQDEAKALFYLQAAANVLLGASYPDPRQGRAGFVSYTRSVTLWPSPLFDVLGRLECSDSGEWIVSRAERLLGAWEQLKRAGRGAS